VGQNQSQVPEKIRKIETYCVYEDIIYCAKVDTGSSSIQTWMRVHDILVLVQELSTDGYVSHLFRQGAILGGFVYSDRWKSHEGIIRIWDIVTREHVNDIVMPGKGEGRRVRSLPLGLCVCGWEEEVVVFGLVK